MATPNYFLSNPVETNTYPGGSNYNLNPLQFATADTANSLAASLGGGAKAYSQSMVQGPYSAPPQQMINYNGQTMNAGLLQNMVNRYGSVDAAMQMLNMASPGYTGGSLVGGGNAVQAAPVSAPATRTAPSMGSAFLPAAPAPAASTLPNGVTPQLASGGFSFIPGISGSAGGTSPLPNGVTPQLASGGFSFIPGISQATGSNRTYTPVSSDRVPVTPTGPGGPHNGVMSPLALSNLQASLSAGLPDAGRQATGPSLTPTGGQSNATTFAPAQPSAPANTAQQAAGGQPNSIDQFLANYVANGGNPVDQTAMWQKAVDAMQRQIQEGYGNLNAQFNASGNRFSTSYGQAAADYQGQATSSINAMLAQYQNQALENAASRQMTAAGQLSGQAFQGQELSQNQAFQAAMQAAGLSSGAAQMLAQMGATGAQGLYGTQNQAAQSMYGQEAALLPFLLQNQNQAASTMGSQELQNQGLGLQLGQTQYNDLQSAINSMYQQYYQTLPQTNPLLQYMMQGSTTYPQMMYPTVQPGQLGQTLGGIGGLIGGLGGLLGGLGLGSAGGAGGFAALLPLLGLSDERTKEDVKPVDGALTKLSKIRNVSFKYRGVDGKHIGVLAQDVEKEFPELVHEVEGVKFVNYMELSSVAIQAVKELNQRLERVEALLGA